MQQRREWPPHKTRDAGKLGGLLRDSLGTVVVVQRMALAGWQGVVAVVSGRRRLSPDAGWRLATGATRFIGFRRISRVSQECMAIAQLPQGEGVNFATNFEWVFRVKMAVNSDRT
jgi:hypothetical protein